MAARARAKTLAEEAEKRQQEMRHQEQEASAATGIAGRAGSDSK
jgi:hypothetical protein